MSAYFTITAVAPTSQDDVIKCLGGLEEEKGDHVDLYVSESGSMMCMPGETLHDTEGVEASLSKCLGAPVIDLHYSDDALWGYVLFQSGHEVDRYSSRPNYWEKQSEKELENQSGDASIVASTWPNVAAAVGEEMERYREQLDNQ